MLSNKEIQFALSELKGWSFSDNKIQILGGPIPINNNRKIDWYKDDNFNFEYEIGLEPDFQVEMTKNDKINYYCIQADNILIEKYINDIAKKYGEISSFLYSSGISL